MRCAQTRRATRSCLHFSGGISQAPTPPVGVQGTRAGRLSRALRDLGSPGAPPPCRTHLSHRSASQKHRRLRPGKTLLNHWSERKSQKTTPTHHEHEANWKIPVRRTAPSESVIRWLSRNCTPTVKPRVSIYLILLLLLIPACAGPGKPPQLILIYTSRRELEDYCRTEAIDPHRYRLGRDIVVFVGEHELVTTLYMCAASEYTPQELILFRPAYCRRGMPDRSDPIFKGLRTSGINVSGQPRPPGDP